MASPSTSPVTLCSHGCLTGSCPVSTVSRRSSGVGNTYFHHLGAPSTQLPSFSLPYLPPLFARRSSHLPLSSLVAADLDSVTMNVRRHRRRAIGRCKAAHDGVN